MNELRGNGSWHVDYNVCNIDGINVNVTFSNTSESVYVTYYNENNGKKVVVRFSNHECNAVRFGDYLNGNTASMLEIMYHLGLASRVFVPNKILFIHTRKVKKTEVNTYDVAELTISEMYALGAWADISAYRGKLAKGSNYLILGDTVEEVDDAGINALGQKVIRGKYVYSLNH